MILVWVLASIMLLKNVAMSYATFAIYTLNKKIISDNADHNYMSKGAYTQKRCVLI